MRRTRLRAAAAQATIDPRQDPLNARTTTEEIPPTPDAQPNHAVIESSAADSDSEANVFKILLATDNHIGFMEKDPVRGMDSFDSFEEVLKLATESDVDFILLGGDLFHDNKPSRKSLHTTMSLLRKYCLGDRVCPIEFLSDQKENFPNGFNTVNYQDPNINVGLPVFSIHGNHDDPSGDGSLCALDLLSVAGLVNYFGKQVDVDDIAIKPLLLRKGTSKLALYGLGNVRDERLNRTFQRKNVKMYRPQEYADEWFNLMVIHQNRVPHGPNNHIPEQFLDDFLHLVLWGHEHECLVDPVHVPLQDFWITQPGSSVATSLCEGEATPKHVAILKIDGQNFNIEKVRLRSVRPFIIDEVCLKDQDDLSPADPKTVNQFLQDKVEELMEKALAEWNELNPGVSEQNVPKPLVRLKVEYSGGFTTFNPQRFGQAFVDKVANPKDILQFYRRRAPPQSAGKRKGITRIDVGAFLPDKLENFRVEDLVSEYLNLQNLEILPENELGDAVRTFVEKDDKDAIKDFITESLKKTRTYLQGAVPTAVEDESRLKEEVDKEKKARSAEFEASVERRKQQPQLLSATRGGRGPSTSLSEDEMEVDGMEGNADEEQSDPAPRRGRGRGRGATTSRKRAAPATGRSRATTSRTKKATHLEEEIADVVDDEELLSDRTSTPTSKKRRMPSSISGIPAKRGRTVASASGTRQSRLNFSQSGNSRPIVLEDDEDMSFSNFKR